MQVKNILVCDFENVILKCENKRVDTFVGTLAVLCMLLSLYFAFGSTGTLVLGWLSLPVLILWFVYGYTPGCVPMIPACLGEDISSIMTWLLPLHFTWPAELQKIPGCAFNESIPHQQCFLPCSSLGYTSWEPVLAWAACDWDPDWCGDSVAPWAGSAGLTTFQQALLQKHDKVVSDHGIDAERFCFANTAVLVVPYIMLAIGIVYAAGAAAAVPLVFLQGVADVLFQALAYVHANTPGRLPPLGADEAALQPAASANG